MAQVYEQVRKGNVVLVEGRLRISQLIKYAAQSQWMSLATNALVVPHFAHPGAVSNSTRITGRPRARSRAACSRRRPGAR
jgi:hypothetical protein